MRKSSSMILSELAWANFVAPTGSRWQHKKGGEYRVIGHSFATERQEVDVIYVRTAGPDFDLAVDPQIPYNRPVSLWSVDRFVEITQ
jgi:hypothetical protein